MSPNKTKPKVPAKPARLSAKKLTSNNTVPLAVSKEMGFESNLSKMSKTPVKMRELIKTVNGSTDFEVETFIAQPGYSSTFPFLSTLAPRFQFYRFKKLNFELVARCAATVPGTMGLVPEFNPEEQTPSSQSVVANNSFAKADAPWKGVILRCDPKMMFAQSPHKSVRTYRGPESILYDAMKLNVWTNGQSNANAIADLYVEYEIDLWAPQITDLIITPRLMSDYRHDAAQIISATGLWIGCEIDAIYDPLHVGEHDGAFFFSPLPGAYRIIVKGNLEFNSTGSPNPWQSQIGLQNENLVMLDNVKFGQSMGSGASTSITDMPFTLQAVVTIAPSNIPTPKKVRVACLNTLTALTIGVVNLSMVWEYA